MGERLARSIVDAAAAAQVAGIVVDQRLVPLLQLQLALGDEVIEILRVVHDLHAD